MSLSYWEHKSWLSNVDYTIVGSGIVGLNCALYLKERHPKARILVLEKGILPQGASTKNAGFACFGSISEILADLGSHSPEEVFQLVEKRWLGIQGLRNTLGDRKLDYQQHGGHELFLNTSEALYEHCQSNLKTVNDLLRPIFKSDAFVSKDNRFGFKGIQPHYISNVLEAQIDTGKMMDALIRKVHSKGIKILNSVAVHDFQDAPNLVHVATGAFEFNTAKLLVATNGFASQLLNETVQPARAQVIITKPIKDLPIKGTFHLDEGFYYFRNINDRILFGGGRNLDFKAEETYDHGTTAKIQRKLEEMLQTMILPGTAVDIERRWSGIMGVGASKKPIVRQLSEHVYCGVRLGGMGVAIGSQVGKELAELSL